MKNGLLILILIMSVIGIAQNPKHEKKRAQKELHQGMTDWTPQQIADLKTKKMTLHLDLDKTQQSEIKKVILSQATARKELRKTNKKNKTPSIDEQVERKLQLLDEKIELKTKMKAILNAEQFEKWEKELLVARRKGKPRCKGERTVDKN